MEKKLYKSRTNIKIDGVCAGLAKFTGIDVTLVRLAMVAVAWFGPGIVIYIACALIVPREPVIMTDEVKYYNDQENGSN